MNSPRDSENFLIVFTHVRHYETEGIYYAHGPYVREIDALSQDGRDVVVVAPVMPNVDAAARPENVVSYERISKFVSLPVVGGDTFLSKVKYLWYGPVIILRILSSLRLPGVIHIRAPGSIALIAVVCALIFARRRKKFAKFAAEWDSPESLPFTFRLQRFLLLHRVGFNGPVFIYSDRTAPGRLVPAFTSSLRAAEIEAANRLARSKKMHDAELVLVFAGRLVQNKGLDVLLSALSMVDKDFGNWRLVVMGRGSQEENLKRQATELGIAHKVEWKGWCSQKSIMSELARAHIVCQPTRYSESWGKVLQEGMAFGCIPIAAAVGGLKRQLKDRPELLFDSGDAAGCARIILGLACEKLPFDELRDWSLKQSRLFSIDGLAEFIWSKYYEYYDSRKS